MKKEHLEESLKLVFDQYKKVPGLTGELAARGYVASIPKKGKIMFVGINPSWLEDTKSYTYEIRDAVKGYPSHYGKFQQIATALECEDDWTYLDLLQVRETSQSRTMDLLKAEQGVDFIVKQLQVTMELLEHLKPELIIVCNSGARGFFGKHEEGGKNVWMGYQFKFNESFGVDVITGLHPDTLKKQAKITALEGVPVYFTSTLTYQDKSSAERLIWQVRRILTYYPYFFGKGVNMNSASRELLKMLTTKMIESNQSAIESANQKDYESMIHHAKIESLLLEQLREFLMVRGGEQGKRVLG